MFNGEVHACSNKLRKAKKKKRNLMMLKVNEPINTNKKFISLTMCVFSSVLFIWVC